MNFKEDIYKLLTENVDLLKTKVSLFKDIDESKLIRDCNFIQYKLNVLDKAKSSPSAFAVFGESQVGKSFLISELIGGEKSKLNIKGYENKSFISLNDSHTGGETTALVTRLTKVLDPNVPDKHVKIRLMKIEDLIWSTANGFYSELMGYNLELPENIDYVIKDYISNIKTVLDTDDGHKLGEIMTKNIINAYVNCVNNLENSYKNNAVIENVIKVKDFVTNSDNQSKIANLSIKSLELIIKTIWMDKKILNDYFSLQLRLLEYINYQDQLYLHHDNIKSIINVGDEVLKLDSITSDQFPKVDNSMIKLSESENKVEGNLLQLIIKEVIIPINSDSKILSVIDILDFPGARSMGQEIDLEDITPNNWSEMFKRGKIKYFFNHYVEIHEITYLLLALSLDNQPEVKNLPAMIKDWKDALGDEINNKLFIALTKSDVLLNNKSTKKQFVEMINKKMKAFLVHYESIKLNDWNETGKPFSDYYFVRNPMADNRGYDKKGALNPEYTETLKDLLYAFKNSEELTKILTPSQIKEIFDNTYNPPQNGIEYLIKNVLSKIGMNPSEAKYNYLNKNMEQINKDLLNILRTNGVIPLNEKEKQNLEEIKSLVTSLKGKDYHNLINFLDNFVNSFPDSQTLHNIIISNQNNTSIWGTNTDTTLNSIEEFVGNWFRYKINRKELCQLSEVEPHILTNYLKNMKNEIISIINDKYIGDINNYLSEVSENNSQILCMILRWICGQYFTYLGDDLEYQAPSLTDIPKGEIMPKRILGIWEKRLVAIYSGEKSSSSANNNNEELISIYNKLS